MKLDTKAVYNPRTETIRTGDGRFVSSAELYKAIANLNVIYLLKIARRIGVQSAVGDPFEVNRMVVVEDLVDLCRSMPKYTLPLIEAGNSIDGVRPFFKGLLRDRAFGSSDTREVDSDHTRGDDTLRDQRITAFFYKARFESGEVQFFVMDDQERIGLAPGEVAADELYREGFLIYRSHLGRYFLRWPTNHRDTPAYYFEGDRPVHFFPHDEDDEALDFEELFPGYVYEVFGVQFSLPDLGTDYTQYMDEEEETESGTWDLGREPEPEVEDRMTVLLGILETDVTVIRTKQDLSKHYRKLSREHHPLKHLDASEEERARIEERFLEITNAYNELKAYFG